MGGRGPPPRPPERSSAVPNAGPETLAHSRSAATWIATAGGLGYAPAAPGTVASAVTAAIFVLLSLPGWGITGLAARLSLLGVLALVLALGVWSAGAAEPLFGAEDDRRIVIDEVAGQLLTLAPLAGAGGAPTGGALLPWVVTGFVLFRVLDVWKPGPVRWAERRFRGGFGVMADDLVAGAIGALLLVALRAVLGAAGGPA